MKVLFDVNVILDVLLARKEFVEVSASLMGKVESGKLSGYLCATTVTTLDYLLLKALNKSQARDVTKKLLELFQVADVNERVLQLSVNSNFGDFEDAVQYYSGQLSGVDCIVTRNIKDYKNAKLPVYNPEELLGVIESTRVD